VAGSLQDSKLVETDRRNGGCRTVNGGPVTGSLQDSKLVEMVAAVPIGKIPNILLSNFAQSQSS
jgi:hypothetical protein